MNILLVEPYYGGSHRAWAEGYAVHSGHSVTLLALPARFWKWRMQGGAVTLAEQTRTLESRPDVILASDMLNLPVFLGLTRDTLGDVPAALYCHETQLTYPLPPGEKRDLTYGTINWLSMIVADRVFFNSRFHLEDWFEELPRMLKHFPEFTHVHLVPEVMARSGILPVGCDLRRFDAILSQGPPPADGPPIVLWNQRWEYDKAPQTFLRALCLLAGEGVSFRVALAGKNYRQTSAEFLEARERLGDRVIHFGYASPGEYGRLMHRADVVVSTAIHEFFGVSVVEAVYCGCFPVLPCRLAYPEIIPEEYHGECLYDDFDGLMALLRGALSDRERARGIAASLGRSVARYDWGHVAPRVDAALETVVSCG